MSAANKSGKQRPERPVSAANTSGHCNVAPRGDGGLSARPDRIKSSPRIAGIRSPSGPPLPGGPGCRHRPRFCLDQSPSRSTSRAGLLRPRARLPGHGPGTGHDGHIGVPNGSGRHHAGPVRARGHARGGPVPAHPARHRRPVAGVRAHRPGRDRGAFLHRARRSVGRRPRPDRGGLASAGGRALLPRHRPGAPGPGAAAALRIPGQHVAGHRGRVLRRQGRHRPRYHRPGH